jgi:hypothetical protein
MRVRMIMAAAWEALVQGFREVSGAFRWMRMSAVLLWEDEDGECL